MFLVARDLYEMFVI